MKKALFIILVVILCLTPLFFANCQRRVTENEDATLSQIPYTFCGEEGDWQVSVDIRAIKESDLGQLEQSGNRNDTELLQNGFRSAVRILYSGPEKIKSLSYTFGQGSQWEYENDLVIDMTTDTINSALTGTYDLSGVAYSPDAKTGGPLPPKDRSYDFRLVAQTTADEEITAQMTLAVTQSGPQKP